MARRGHSWYELSPTPKRGRLGSILSEGPEVESASAETRSEAIDEVIHLLLRFQREKKSVTAQFVTSIAFWLAQSGLEELEPLAVDPRSRHGATGGNCQRKLD
eukprot:1743542-Amphidinium_carterae.1